MKGWREEAGDFNPGNAKSCLFSRRVQRRLQLSSRTLGHLQIMSARPRQSPGRMTQSGASGTWHDVIVYKKFSHMQTRSLPKRSWLLIIVKYIFPWKNVNMQHLGFHCKGKGVTNVTTIKAQNKHTNNIALYGIMLKLSVCEVKDHSKVKAAA